MLILFLVLVYMVGVFYVSACMTLAARAAERKGETLGKWRAVPMVSLTWPVWVPWVWATGFLTRAE